MCLIFLIWIIQEVKNALIELFGVRSSVSPGEDRGRWQCEAELPDDQWCNDRISMLNALVSLCMLGKLWWLASCHVSEHCRIWLFSLPSPRSWVRWRCACMPVQLELVIHRSHMNGRNSPKWEAGFWKGHSKDLRGRTLGSRRPASAIDRHKQLIPHWQASYAH